MRQRVLLCVLLCVVVGALHAVAPVVDLLKIGYDLATIKRVTKMDIDGVQISLGGISVKGLKRTMARYDFTDLEFEDRLALYEKAKVPIALPAVRNALQGMGKGSKSQGDLGGKLFGIVGDYTSYGVISVGIILIAIDAFIVGVFSGGDPDAFDWDNTDDELLTMGKDFVKWGLVGFAAQRLLQLLIPIDYGKRYNTALRDGLGILRGGGDGFSVVVVEGQAISLGGSSIKAREKNLAAFDFSTVNLYERLAFYDEVKIPITWPVFKNLLLGFGSGSKSQGDRSGALVGAILDSTSLAAVGVGFGLGMLGCLSAGSQPVVFLDGSVDMAEYPGTLMRVGYGLFIGGLVGLAASRITQAVLPISYGARHNKALRDGLGIQKDGGDGFALSMALVPVLSADKELSVGFAVASRVSF